MMYRSLIFLFLILFLSVNLKAQYVLNGSATLNSCNCYTLTPAEAWKSGSVWNSQKINLKNPFDFKFNVFLGCSSSPGADGIVFILQPNSTSIGASGEGMGFNGISPSVGIALDTWQNFNLNDPAYDHISIQLNGNVNHNFDIAGPVPISATTNDVEDCKWHKLRITWDPLSKWYKAYFNDVLRVEVQIDLIANVFNSDPFVFWGFSAATGGEWNLQQFCTALNPEFKTSTGSFVGCVGAPVSFFDASESFTNISSYIWTFGDGTTSTLKDPPPHSYAEPGIYQTKLSITALDGCTADSTKFIKIGSLPKAEFSIKDTCETKPIDFLHKEEGISIEYKWLLNDQVLNTDVSTALKNLPHGDYQLKLNAHSSIGCGLVEQSTSYFTIKPKPLIEHVVKDGCINEDIQFSALQIDNITFINSWQWQIGNSDKFNEQNIIINYPTKGDYTIKTWAQADNGCYSDTLSSNTFINKAVAFAGRDTLILSNVPHQLNATGNGSFSWSPATGLNNQFIYYPITTLSDDQEYQLTVITSEGCLATDSLKVKVFKGSSVFVPNAFSPNGDGLNDIFKPIFTGISKLHYLYIYNRWGHLIFKTTSTTIGWDGRNMSKDSASGVYIWILEAEDISGRIYQLKGTITLIR